MTLLRAAVSISRHPCAGTKKKQKSATGSSTARKGVRAQMKWFHDHGYGNSGATSGHLIPGYERALKIGWKGICKDLEERYNALSPKDKKGKKGAQLRAMMTAAATMPGELADKYANLCEKLAAAEKNAIRRDELDADGEKSAPCPLGTGPDLLGGRAVSVAHAYAGHER